jgi:hypothetical protein
MLILHEVAYDEKLLDIWSDGAGGSKMGALG